MRKIGLAMVAMLVAGPGAGEQHAAADDWDRAMRLARELADTDEWANRPASEDLRGPASLVKDLPCHFALTAMKMRDPELAELGEILNGMVAGAAATLLRVNPDGAADFDPVLGRFEREAKLQCAIHDDHTFPEMLAVAADELRRRLQSADAPND